MVVVAFLISRDGYNWGFAIKKVPVSYIVLISLGMMGFKDMLQVMGTLDGTVDMEVSPVTIAILLPFIVGFATGLVQGFVGVTFPLLAIMVRDGGLPVGLFALAYAAGFAGIMLSPAHICLPLSVKYFGTSWKKLYPLLIIGEGVILIVAVLLLVFREMSWTLICTNSGREIASDLP